MIERVIPLVLHPSGAPLRVLAFLHPDAGAQLVQGTLGQSEHPLRAASRALWGVSGLTAISAMDLGTRDDIIEQERWHFALVRIRPPVRDRFQHFCADDGGHLFEFFWHDLNDQPGPFAAPLDKALEAAREALNSPA